MDSENTFTYFQCLSLELMAKRAKVKARSVCEPKAENSSDLVANGVKLFIVKVDNVDGVPWLGIVISPPLWTVLKTEIWGTVA